MSTPPEPADPLVFLIRQWRDDPGGTYRTWFLWDERLKNFRSIRRGLQAVIGEIAEGHFGNVYKGSSLETVVGSIAEQRQIFKGADHAFLWKPKLRIPDIYENPENQKAFGQFLGVCLCCNGAGDLVAAIQRLDAQKIKGLGPAVANLLYFVHPTLAVPSNTAIVRGYNAITGSRVKLGSWTDYLAMREGVLRLNGSWRDLFSNDLGAIAGFLFDVGTGRYPAPPRERDTTALQQWEEDLARVRKEAQAAAGSARADEEDRTHAEVQSWLRDLGIALGFDVWIASNDQGRLHDGRPLGDGCCAELPPRFDSDTVRLIDVIWLNRATRDIAAAFEVEHTTSIYSGILRLFDLARSSSGQVPSLYLVAHDKREPDIRAQLQRPAFRSDLTVRFLPYGELASNRDAITRFGQGLKPIEAIARSV